MLQGPGERVTPRAGLTMREPLYLSSITASLLAMTQLTLNVASTW